MTPYITNTAPGTAWSLDIDSNWIAWLTFDAPDEKVNTFNAQSMADLDSILDQLARNEAIKAIAIRSGKDINFIAGADISELAKLTTPEEAKAIGLRGQNVFAKLTAMPVPTVAVIHGSCMGGGLELALACHYRIVTDDPKTTLALPEVKLGILPAWNGTCRLPRLIGLAAAMDMILAGKTLVAKQAQKCGLADRIIAKVFLEQHTTEFIDTILRRSGKRAVQLKRKRARKRLMKLMEATPMGRALMYRAAKKTVLAKTHGHYPAPLKTIEVLRKTYKRTTIEQGGIIEADALAELALSSESRNLVWLFEASQRSKKAINTVAGKSDHDLSHAAIIGAGIMGSGIAWACAHAGMDVRIKDMNYDAITKGTSSIASMFHALVKRRKMTAAQYNMAMHRVTGTTDYSGFAQANVVIEAIVENLDIKIKVLREIEEHVSDDCIICTNTSSLPLNVIAATLKRPQRFLGLHFFNPVNRMPLVEIVPSNRTSPQTVAAAVQLVKSMQKTPTVVGSCAGFLVNRILVPYLVESAWMLQEGAAPQRIDNLLVEFGMPMGPLELIDEVGIDVGHTVAKVLENAYGERMKVPAGLSAIAASGEFLGKKTKHGIYLYTKKDRKPNPAIRALVNNAQQSQRAVTHQLSDADIVDRAILLMVNEAARCLEENIAPDPESLDMAMVFGTGFAPFRGGLLRYADERGVANVRNRLNELAAMYGERFAPAPLIDQIASSGGQFYQHEYNNRKGSRNVA